MQNPGTAAGQAGRMFAGGNAQTAGLDSEQAYRRIGNKRMEEADCIRAATNAGHHGIRQASGFSQNLLPGFLADNPLKIPYQFRVGVRAGGGAQQVVSAVDMGDPVA